MLESRDGGVELASALTKVARLAADSEPEALPAARSSAATISRHRVRRLLESPAGATGVRLGLDRPRLAVALALVLQTTPARLGLHEVLETLVRRRISVATWRSSLSDQSRLRATGNRNTSRW